MLLSKLNDSFILKCSKLFNSSFSISIIETFFSCFRNSIVSFALFIFLEPSQENGFTKIHLTMIFLFDKYSAIAFVEPLPTPPPKVAIIVTDKFLSIKLSIWFENWNFKWNK